MKQNRLLGAFLCAAMTSAVLIGCSGETKAPAPASTEAPATKEEASKTESPKTAESGTIDYSSISVEIVAKGFQHDFWKAVKMGSEQAAKELGLKSTNFVGPANESAVAEQIEQLNNAVNKQPSAICLAALDTQSSMDAISNAQAAGIPIVGFDSGVPDAPKGAIVANAATDNYVAGGLAAEKMYDIIKEQVTDPAQVVRIGVVSQDATSQSIGERTGGFIDKMRTLIGESNCTVEGHDKYNVKADGAKVIIDVGIPATVDDAACVIVASTLLNKNDLIAIYASNEFTAKNLVTANESLQKLGPDKVIGVGFDSGSIQLDAVKAGILAGSITQNPVQIGYQAVMLAAKAATGQPVNDIDTGCLWYDASNMDSAEVAPCLYK
ncbi:monosaccharide ABC transporter substrate-binding protein, CUT2 family [Clostridium sp. ASBs410]|nr:monosaccharide ABC transporter substrate-binding protein, CUT2 family [Clostridium sp. ASBs410]